jgi:Zn-dependent protease with chaperone function
MQPSFDFQHYVDTRKTPGSRRTAQGGFGEYIFTGDYRVLRSLSYAQPVRLACEASVRAFKTWRKADILGSAVRVGPRQFPRLHDIVTECAQELHIPVPTTYVTQNFGSINAGTFGTETDSFIVINSATVDRLTDDELRFVIGHECGHIQNSHVTYHTALNFLTHVSSIFVRWIVTPARIALMGWSRRGEITCDRAGLICCRDLKVATTTMVKLAGGSQALVDKIDVDTYLNQLDELRDGIGRFSEYFQSHPYLPKRLKALQIFAESEYYRRMINESGGRTMVDVDREVEAIVSVL